MLWGNQPLVLRQADAVPGACACLRITAGTLKCYALRRSVHTSCTSGAPWPEAPSFRPFNPCPCAGLPHRL